MSYEDSDYSYGGNYVPPRSSNAAFVPPKNYFDEKEYSRRYGWGNPNYHYGYTSLPSYTDMPMSVYEQDYRLRQAKIPARIMCGCGNASPVDAIVCVKCGIKFIGGPADKDGSSGKREKFMNLESIASEPLQLMLLFVFIVFITCVYSHICSLNSEIRLLSGRNHGGTLD